MGTVAAMITLERTIRTDRPAGQVFAYLADFTHAEQWDPGTVSCTLLTGDGGVGSRYLNVSRFLGRNTELVYVVQQVDPPHTYAVEGKNKTVTSTDTISISTRPSGTDVTYRAVFAFHGVARLAEPLLRLAIKQLGDRAETTLRNALQQLPS